MSATVRSPCLPWRWLETGSWAAVTSPWIIGPRQSRFPADAPPLGRSYHRPITHLLAPWSGLRLQKDFKAYLQWKVKGLWIYEEKRVSNINCIVLNKFWNLYCAFVCLTSIHLKVERVSQMEWTLSFIKVCLYLKKKKLYTAHDIYIARDPRQVAGICYRSFTMKWPKYVSGIFF